MLELATSGSASAAAAADALHAASALHAMLPVAAARAGSAALAASTEAVEALPQLWLNLAEAASTAGAAGAGSVAWHASASATGALPRLGYDLAEAAVAAAPAAPPRDDGWLAPIAQGLDWLLLWFQAQLNAAHVPYASGWAIVCLTLVTKTLTFPFTKIQARFPPAPMMSAAPCSFASSPPCILSACLSERGFGAGARVWRWAH